MDSKMMYCPYIMLGVNNEPILLVRVNEGFDPNNFDFYVNNGAWEGTFNGGDVAVHGCATPAVTNVSILSQNQDRLRGNYQTVFDNWENVDYKSPSYDSLEYDDVAF